jgi:hypothetical protein
MRLCSQQPPYGSLRHSPTLMRLSCSPERRRILRGGPGPSAPQSLASSVAATGGGDSSKGPVGPARANQIASSGRDSVTRLQEFV